MIGSVIIESFCVCVCFGGQEMDNSKNKQNENLSVNKMGKSIRKSPLNQPNSIFNTTFISGRHHQPYPQVVYNINKDDFKEVVQKLTGSPSHVRPPPQSHNSPKPQSTRLQRIRPPPLSNVRSPAPVAPQLVPFNNALLPGGPPAPPPQFIQPSHTPFQGDMTWANNNNVVAESPISAYMRYFQNSVVDHPGSMGDQFQPQPQSYSYPPHTQIPAGNVLQVLQPQPQPYPTLQTQVPSNVLQLQPQPHPPQTQVPAGNVLQPHSPSSALFPNPPDPILHSPRSNGIIVPMNATNPTLPMNANSSSGDQSNPFVPGFPSPQTNEPPILPSPTSQFPLPSPPDYNYMNILSPGSLYPPLLSPGTIEFISSLIPNFPLSPYSQPEILGPGAQPPLSPGLFPMSPTGLFPITSPRWGDE